MTTSAIMVLEEKLFKIEELVYHEVKEDEDKPDFSGVLSVMGVKDLHDEIVDDGAFTRTLAHHKGRFPLLADHNPSGRTRMGMLVAREDGKKLKFDAFVNKEKQFAADMLSDVKFSIAKKIPLGMSIGFETVKEDRIDDIRHLKEIKLWEGSVVTFPANTSSRVTTAKSKDAEPKLHGDNFSLALSDLINYVSSIKEAEEVSEGTRALVEAAVKSLEGLLRKEVDNPLNAISDYLSELYTKDAEPDPTVAPDPAKAVLDFLTKLKNDNQE